MFSFIVAVLITYYSIMPNTSALLNIFKETNVKGDKILTFGGFLDDWQKIPSNSDEKHEYTIHIKRREQIKKKK